MSRFFPMKLTAATLAAATLAAAVPAIAQVPPGNSAPQATPPVDTIPAARDMPYPGGPILIDVDATDTARGLMQVHETIPVAGAGPLVLLYPQWLPGNHSPTGEIEKLAGLHIRANGQPVPWRRDEVDMFAFHIDVPAGARALDVEFGFVSATAKDQGRTTMTAAIVSLQPNQVSLYPAGYYVRQIAVRLTAHFPAGFTAAGALPATATAAAGSVTYTYAPTNYEILVDSPILAGAYGKTWPLSPRVTLNVFADKPAMLAATPDEIAAHARLVDQAVKTFGAQHYDHYAFLLSLSDKLGDIGLEHHRSSENGSRTDYFTDWKENAPSRNLLPHEYSHSWDGKFRRGVGLWTPDYREPMRDDSLWVYEGQTQFWGYVLQARSGLVSKQETLDGYAAILAAYDTSRGREWRPLIDTTNDPVMSRRKPKGWASWQRQEDYYNEGLMVWMEVDALMRRQSGGRKSIDDFARAFFGIRDGDWGEVTYSFDDVARTLDTIVPYDWRGFLTRRLTETGQPAPTQGFVMNGYRLAYSPEQSDFLKQLDHVRKSIDLRYSLGIVVGEDHVVSGTVWGSPAFVAGLDVGSEIVAVDGDVYSAEVVKAAIVRAQADRQPIAMTVKHGTDVRTVTIAYTGGPRYPRLVKIGTGDGGLDRLLMPR